MSNPTALVGRRQRCRDDAVVMVSPRDERCSRSIRAWHALVLSDRNPTKVPHQLVRLWAVSGERHERPSFARDGTRLES